MKVLFVIHQLGFADHISISYLSAIAKQSGHSTHFCVLDHDDFPGMVGQIKPEVGASKAFFGAGHTEEAAAGEAKKARTD